MTETQAHAVLFFLTAALAIQVVVGFLPWIVNSRGFRKRYRRSVRFIRERVLRKDPR